MNKTLPNAWIATALIAAWLAVPVVASPLATFQDAGSGAVAAATPAPPAIMPLGEVAVGMRGTGLTVVQGREPQSFDVEILGILPDAFPKQSLIVARLTGLGLERAGVVAGMSGSPVYVDGRVLGAVAYRLTNFGHEAIAGIMPIESMLRMPEAAGGDATGTEALPEVGPVLRAMAAGLTGEITELPGVTPAGAIAGIEPIATPVAMSGFHPELVRALVPVFAGRGWVVAGGAGQQDLRPFLEPGGAVGVQLVRGDVSVTATGTITYRDGDRLLAFGHPFIQAGAVDFPMVGAEVILVLSGAQASSKLSVAGRDIVGAIRQDRLPAILGRVGAVPRLLPVRTRVRAPGLDERIDFEVAVDPTLTPLYVFLGLVNGVQSVGEISGGGTLQVASTLRLAGGLEVRFDDLYSSRDQAIVRSAADLAGVFDGLYDNDVSPLEVESVHVELTLRDDRRTAAVSRVWFDSAGVEAGGEVTLHVALDPYREPERVVQVPVQIPAGVAAGSYRVVVGDAQGASAAEDRSLGGQPAARTVGELAARFNERRRADLLYVQVFRPLAGARFGAEVMPGLPSSRLRLLAAPAGNDVVALSQSLLSEQRIAVERVITGSHEISLTVRER